MKRHCPRLDPNRPPLPTINDTVAKACSERSRQVMRAAAQKRGHDTEGWLLRTVDALREAGPDGLNVAELSSRLNRCAAACRCTLQSLVAEGRVSKSRPPHRLTCYRLTDQPTTGNP